MKENKENALPDLNSTFWEQKWRTHQTGWDIGYASPALLEFMSGYKNKDASILIPGCGNAYEAEVLADQGFKNITVLDFALEAIQKVEAKLNSRKEIRILHQDFFSHSGKYDLILEQTFFCAINPERRKELVEKMATLLNDNGQWVGLLFTKEFEKPGPPFGGGKEEYVSLFSPFFTIEKLEECYNSIPPRAGSELFMKMRKS